VRKAVAVIVVATVALLAVAFTIAGRDTASATPTYFENVKPILDARCVGCHFDGGIAPFPLTSYGDANAHRAAIGDAVAKRLMPPWHAASGVREYRGDPSLSDEQIETIAGWVAAGGPAGDAADRGPALPPVSAGLSRVDLELPMPQAYTPNAAAGGDDYRCFVLPWTPDAATYVTGSSLTPGEPAEVHHIILYLAPPGSHAMLAAWDAADPGTGYGCYGGPSATNTEENLQTPRFLAGWVPGLAGGDLPAGTGVHIAPGARLILQVHYNLENGAPTPDRSVVQLRLDEQVERPAVYIPLVNPLWVISPRTFAIPAGQQRVPHAFAADLVPFAGFLAPELDLRAGYEIHSAILHMHRLGRSGKITIERVAGDTERLLAVPSWDFHWQREYRLADSVEVDPGDRLAISCEHDNSAAHQPLIGGARAKPRDVTWGEDSSDEMCIGFVYVTER
jgi:hypothetical protein